jgi:hypothetical protein
MTMTRKDYQLIAAALKDAREANVVYTNGEHVTDLCAVRVANALESDNPRFDRARFLAACGVAS